MRPVNLIPPEERRGEKAPTRTGATPYLIVAVLGVALIAVMLVAMTNNQISDRKTEKANLEVQLTQAQAEAQRFQAFADFASLQQAREQTVASLAQSRFDWERVLRELALVIPSDVWLTNLSATVSGETTSSSTSTSSGSVDAPSLEIQGCGAGHESVARFLVALRDVDGLTRATVLSSDRAEGAGGGQASSTGGTAGCEVRNFLSTFEIKAAFDNAVPATLAESTSTTPTTTTTPTSTAQTSTPASSTSSSDESQTSAPELQQQKDSAAQKTEKGHKAVDTFIPGAGSAP
jgi:Tfp pilus assembly protein PilN